MTVPFVDPFVDTPGPPTPHPAAIDNATLPQANNPGQAGAAGNGALASPNNHSHPTPAATPQTLVLIASQVLGSAAASVTFSAIPGTFNAVHLLAAARATGLNQGENFLVQLNGDTGANYDQQGTSAAAAVTTSALRSAGTAWSMDNLTADCAGGASTAGASGALDLILPAYASTTFWKVGRWNSGGAVAGAIGGVTASVAWRSATAVTSVKIALVTGATFAAGSSFYLYGMS